MAGLADEVHAQLGPVQETLFVQGALYPQAKTKTRNGAPVCLYDHWLVHEGGWQILRQPDGALIFIPPPSGWRPGTIYRHGKPLAETHPHSDAA
jgi:hypothetical protein